MRSSTATLSPGVAWDSIVGFLDHRLSPVHVPPGTSKSHAADAGDVVHYIDPRSDSLLSLSLQYAVPIAALRRANQLYADHLLAARKSVVIPGAHYRGGVSHRPTPIHSPEEEQRMAKTLKVMRSCKMADYDLALAYLQQANLDADEAIAAIAADDAWERDHPLPSSGLRLAGRPALRQLPVQGWWGRVDGG
ncbi:MAG: hypothetical protein M1826_005923 [Phylliscum demangeonii]|nr:MAG: hypothetical protein M1826_005923 [Phylliscum demangeonii]